MINEEEKRKFIKLYGPHKFKKYLRLHYRLEGRNKAKFMGWALNVSARTIYQWRNKLFNK